MSEPTAGGAAGEAPARYTAELACRIERRWQDHWAAAGTYHADNPVGPLAGSSPVPRDKLFVQDMFPYPSGAGLHVGHPLGYIATDVYARYHRMIGRNVLHTLGYDAFGLPAEQYAVQTGQHPRTTTEANIATMRGQLRRIGLGHDERRSLATTDPEYYRWTQWIFLRIYDAYFDEHAGKARPISELVAQFEDGSRGTPDGRAWSEHSARERAEVLNSYRLAYTDEAPVNWCPGLGTVLANEEVTAEGRSERDNFPVFQRNLRQWMMRITAYADRLAGDLDRLDWPEKVKSMQRNWIGRSAGARIRFGAAGGGIEVFTTRPDTIFGATYLVLAPEHPMAEKLAAREWAAGTSPAWTYGAPDPSSALAVYQAVAARKTTLDRQENREKTGVYLGASARNPATGEDIPLFVADYVLMGYGTGAIMGVPGEDQRDWDFAEAFGLPIVRTVAPPGDFEGQAYTGAGPAINSGFLNGMQIEEASKAMLDSLVERGAGREAVQYKLRDWLFSRQRYWGEPFPIVYDEDGVAHPVPDDMLPVELPEVDEYSPATYDPDDVSSQPSPPLSKATEWVNVELDLGDGRRAYRRETNTMPNWAGSCWYQLRYIDPTNTEMFCDPVNERYWTGPRPEEHTPGDPGGVDLYVGGVEHAVLHLLYSRFWHKVLFDLGYVSSDEPYRRLVNQGYIQAFAYTDSRGAYVPAEEVSETGEGCFYRGEPVTREYGKMGKSLKNVVTPDEMFAAYGADTFRFYEMSMGPLEVSRPWATKDVVGAHRFLQRLWRTVVDEATGGLRVSEEPPSVEDLRALHRAIAGVREDYAGLRFNTAGAKLIELNNHITKTYSRAAATPRELVEPLVLMLAPLCPHIAEELWHRLGHSGSLVHGPFPAADEGYLAAETVEYPIQVNGKVRSRVRVPAEAGQDAVKAAALGEEKIAEALAGQEPRKLIVVPGRLVNVVV
jgi:leucyl-tRNA synthetase